MKSLKKYTLDIVPDYLDRFLTARNMSLLFPAGQKELQEFSAYCVFRAITDTYQQATPQRALYSHLSQQQEAESGVHDIVKPTIKLLSESLRKGCRIAKHMQNRWVHRLGKMMPIVYILGRPAGEDTPFRISKMRNSRELRP